MIIKYNLKNVAEFTERVFLSGLSNGAYSFTNGNKKVFLDGKFYYDSNSFNVFPIEGDKKRKLSALVKKYDIEKFINNVEGEFWGIEIDYKKKIFTVFNDKLKQKEVFYFFNDNVFLASDNLTEIISAIGVPGYEKNSFVSSVLLYPPKGQTIFKGIKRLRYNEILKVSKGRVQLLKSNDDNVDIENYTDKDLLNYEKILTNSVLSRASKKMNLVFSSGGWDSTMLLAILTKYLGKRRVRGVTFKVIMSDGRCFNQYEVEKAGQIGKALGIKTEIVEIDYRRKETAALVKGFFEDPTMNNLFLLFLAPANWSGMVEFIKKKYGKETVVFDGDGSDSLHNFGFSQYISLQPHTDDNFLEYGDKMKNYLFGPTFFEGLKDNKFLKDLIYKIFRLLSDQPLYELAVFSNRKEFVDVTKMKLEDKIYYYLLSFVYSDIRLPFRKLEYKRFIKDIAFGKFNSWLRNEYFQEITQKINKNNLYYYFSLLYISFHLQSPPIRIYRQRLDNVRFPYIDSHLFRYLYKMPESFGRGLEWRSIKFPEKQLAKKIFSPEILKIVSSGPHSYLSETGEEINIYNEYFLKGPVYAYLRSRIDFEKCKDILDDKTFVTDEMEKLAKNFREGKIKNISFVEARMLIIMLLLSTRVHSIKQQK